jgi:hypothetical protein
MSGGQRGGHQIGSVSAINSLLGRGWLLLVIGPQMVIGAVAPVPAVRKVSRPRARTSFETGCT